MDGQDVLDVSAAMERAVNRARAGEGPSIIEAKTYRYYGHHGADDPPPLPHQRRGGVLPEQGLHRDIQDQAAERRAEHRGGTGEYRRSILQSLDEAVQFADESPWPDPEELVADVYVNY